MNDHDDARCARCRRPLHADLSRLAGYGARCALRALGDRPTRPRPAAAGQLDLLDDDLKESA